MDPNQTESAVHWVQTVVYSGWHPEPDFTEAEINSEHSKQRYMIYRIYHFISLL